MKTTITIWHKDNDAFTLYSDSAINYLPLQKGDKFYMNFEELSPIREGELRTQYAPTFVDYIKKDTNEKRGLYRHGEWEVVKVTKAFRIEQLREDTFTVEYHIKKVFKVYWKFWRLYKWKQFWKSLFNKLK
jgi:hypothetical protein